MTDNEIIKALECCRVEGHCADGCPYYGNFFKKKQGALMKKEGIIPKALDLINRQSAEIDILIRKKHTLRDEIAELRAEIERLTTYITNELATLPINVRNEAYKEFVKRFEKKIKNVNFTIGQTWEIQCALKQTAIELSEVSDNA